MSSWKRHKNLNPVSGKLGEAHFGPLRTLASVSFRAVECGKLHRKPMTVLKPTLKRWADLTERDFIEHPAWTAWYAPDEMEALVSLGFDEVETKRVLQSVDWSDEYAFPLPAAGAAIPFMRLCISAQITTKGGHVLHGYLASAAVTVFHRGRRYAFNRALRDLSVRQAEALGTVLAEASLFPLQVHLTALSRTQEFDLGER